MPMLDDPGFLIVLTLVFLALVFATVACWRIQFKGQSGARSAADRSRK
jgi:hypothetical protein